MWFWGGSSPWHPVIPSPTAELPNVRPHSLLSGCSHRPQLLCHLARAWVSVAPLTKLTASASETYRVQPATVSGVFCFLQGCLARAFPLTQPVSTDAGLRAASQPLFPKPPQSLCEGRGAQQLQPTAQPQGAARSYLNILIFMSQKQPNSCFLWPKAVTTEATAVSLHPSFPALSSPPLVIP